MNWKCIVSLAVVVVGAGFVAFGLDSMNKLSAAKELIEQATHSLSRHPIGKKLNASIEKETRSAEQTSRFYLYTGLGLIAVGAGAAIFYRKPL